MSKYSNLHEKTVYDFTNDEALLDEITVIDKDDYLNELAERPVINAFHLIELAERTKNNELMSAVKSQYKAELEAVNNE